jgi:hypothetical protein
MKLMKNLALIGLAAMAMLFGSGAAMAITSSQDVKVAYKGTDWVLMDVKVDSVSAVAKFETAPADQKVVILPYSETIKTAAMRIGPMPATLGTLKPVSAKDLYAKTAIAYLASSEVRRF